jgi:cyclopropane fatty-acyl-phospholipid synthase-like methyltransferase
MEKHERFRWVVEILKVKPDDYILEIGCGVGFAVEEIVQHLVTGKITAIDKSPAMIEKAIRRNQKNIKQDKAKFVQSELLGFEEKDVKYNKIFCFNINLFWTRNSIGREISAIRSILLRKGLVYIFYGPMLGDGFEKITSPLRKNLEKENLKVIDFVREKKLKCCCFVVALHFKRPPSA